MGEGGYLGCTLDLRWSVLYQVRCDDKLHAVQSLQALLLLILYIGILCNILDGLLCNILDDILYNILDDTIQYTVQYTGWYTVQHT